MVYETKWETSPLKIVSSLRKKNKINVAKVVELPKVPANLVSNH